MNKIVGVYKRGDNRWEARYKKGVDGKGHTVYGSVYAKTKEEANEKRQFIVGDVEIYNAPTAMNLLILGAGSHGRDVREIAEQLRVFKKISFLDDEAEGQDIIGRCKDALDFRKEYPCAVVAIGDNAIRKKYARFLKERHFLLPNIISPAANISPNARIGEGVVVLPQCTVRDAVIGDCCILASNSLVENDAEVGDFVRLDAGAIVAKGNTVAKGLLVESGQIVK